MDSIKLKRGMMKLWKDTFHDSDAYITMVFDNYFNPDTVVYHEENGIVVSALLGIPYTFVGSGREIKGLYLCGLATKESHRGQGLISGLLEKINIKAKEEGYSFTFLIPASDSLRIFYSRRGFRNATYRVEDRYTSMHDFDNDFLSTLHKYDDRIKELKKNAYNCLTAEKLKHNDEETIGELIDFIHANEERENKFTGLLHSCIDLRCVVIDNIISGGVIVYCRNTDGDITGVLFAIWPEPHEMVVQHIYYSDILSYYKVLAKLHSLYPDDSFGVYCYPENTNRQAIWSMVYGASDSDGELSGGAYGAVERVYDVNHHSHPYGMVHVLSYSEILKFLVCDRKDCKFSILVKEGGEGGKDLLAETRNGKVSFREISKEERNENVKDVTKLSRRDLNDLIFRKRDMSQAIFEAFGIPRMAMNFSLMLE